jgi:heptosyltransferase-2/heptosyltransferase-3
MKRSSERPLAVRCGAFGDMVLLTALIRVLHAQFRCPVDVVTSGPWSEPLLQGQPGVGEIFSMRSRRAPYWLSVDQQRVVRRLRARGVGPTWLCDSDQGVQHILDKADIGAADIVAARDHPLLVGEHATAQWRRMAQIMPASSPRARSIDLAAITPGCCLEVTAAQRADLDAWLGARGIADAPLLLVQAGNKRTMRRGPRRLAVNHKYWPNERWAQVLRFMREHNPRHRIVLLGTGPEYELNQQIVALAGIDRLHNAADDLPIPRLVALLQRADGLLNVDSGPAHAGAAVGCPQVVLFGRASPSLYRPWGTSNPDVQLLTGEVDGQPSMLGISSGQVIDAWTGLKLRSASGG